MQINEKLIENLEDLSFFNLSADEKNCFREDLEEVIFSTKGLLELNTDGAAECTHIFNKVNVFREDEVVPSPDREKILENAPKKNTEFFIAPKTVD